MITIYKTKRCAYCAQVKKYFDLKGVEYRVVDMDEEPEALQKWTSRGIMTVPIMEKEDGRYTVGWNPGQLAEFIK